MKTRRLAALLFPLLLAGQSSVGAFVAPVRYDVPVLRSGPAFTPGVGLKSPGSWVPGGDFALGPGAPQLKGSLLLPHALIPTLQDAPVATVAPLSFASSGESGVSAARGLNLLSQRGVEFSPRVFDGAGFRLDGEHPASGAEQPAGPKLPPGVKKVVVDVVRTAADVDRLIPSGANSDKFKALLKKSLGSTAPFYVYTYHDAKGGTMVALDLSAKPGLLDSVPELQRHEKALIRKIQVWNRDLQVLVREDGKTPDLIVGGLVTEIKSQIGDYPMMSLVKKANEQVLEHGRRHGLGRGAVAVDLVGEDKVQVEEVRRALSDWGRATKDLALNKIFVFWEDELRVFLRQADGSFEPAPPGIPLQGGGPFRPDALGPADFTRRGFSSRMKAILDGIRDEHDAERAARKIRKFATHGRSKEAAEVWRRFAAGHSGAIVPDTWAKIAPFLPGLR